MRHSNIRWLAFVPILVFCTLVSAGGIDLAASIDALLADPALKYGIQGVVVESLSTGEVLYERNRNIAFVPASNFKLIVSAAALDCFDLTTGFIPVSTLQRSRFQRHSGW